jgi:hypothetical protein
MRVEVYKHRKTLVLSENEGIFKRSINRDFIFNEIIESIIEYKRCIRKRPIEIKVYIDIEFGVDPDDFYSRVVFGLPLNIELIWDNLPYNFGIDITYETTV